MIRLAKKKDLNKCVALGLKFWEESNFNDFLGEVDDQSISIMMRQLIESASLFVIDDGGIKGILGFQLFKHPMKESVNCAQELFWWVDSEYRGGGNGLLLLEKAESILKARGIKRIVMITLEGLGNDRIGGIYEQSGYKLLEHIYTKGL
jgi:GNAT superfamily N-acetyltransferase